MRQQYVQRRWALALAPGNGSQIDPIMVIFCSFHLFSKYGIFECLLCAKPVLSSECTTINNLGKVPALMTSPFASNWLEVRYVMPSWVMGSEVCCGNLEKVFLLDKRETFKEKLPALHRGAYDICCCSSHVLTPRVNTQRMTEKPTQSSAVFEFLY